MASYMQKCQENIHILTNLDRVRTQSGFSPDSPVHAEICKNKGKRRVVHLQCWNLDLGRNLLYCKSVKKTYTFSPSPDWVRTRSGLGPDSPEPAGICKNQQKMNTTTEIINHVRTRVRTRNTEMVGKLKEKLQSVRTPRLAFKI